jgi:6-phosphogluconolactonase
MNSKTSVLHFDDRRDLFIAENATLAIDFSVQQFIEVGKKAIDERGQFTVALSGGSTPKAIFEKLSQSPYKELLDWKRVLLFWSDERCVEPTNSESNYKMAMDAGFSKLAIPMNQIFRMPADAADLKAAANAYEKQILNHVQGGSFDLMMLGMGDDGHTASLFPHTEALHATHSLITPNYIPQKDVWRLSVTFKCINIARHIAIYVIGKNKAEMVKTVLLGRENADALPIQQVGTSAHKALWILDRDAARLLEGL